MPCNFCPRHCAVNREFETGYCGAGPLPRVARVAPHHWEEPMLSGGRGAGTIFFSGCNLSCVFCQNEQISAHQKGELCDAGKLCELFLELQAKGAHNIELVTPTPHLKIITEALKLVKGKELRIPVVYNTGGYDCVEAIDALDGLVDIYLPDLKYCSSKRSALYCGAPDYFLHACAAIRHMHAQVGDLQLNDAGLATRGLLIRHLVLPGNLDETRCIMEFLSIALPLGTYISLMRQYTPMQPDLPAPLHRKLTSREYGRALDICQSFGFSNILTQEAGSADASYLPQFYDEL